MTGFWSTLMTDDFDASWATALPHILSAVTSAQYAAGVAAIAYVPAVLTETGITAPASASVNILGFVGSASDGRSLSGLLLGAVISAKEAVGEGFTTPQALARGKRWLQMAAISTIADTSRAAAMAAMTVRPAIPGWWRFLDEPSCKRCTVLASRWYAWHEPMHRHPGDQCIPVPSSEEAAQPFLIDPLTYFENLDEAEQNDLFGLADSAAIRGGASIRSVIETGNGAMTAAESRGKQTLDSILLESHGDRATAIALMKSNGFTL